MVLNINTQGILMKGSSKMKKEELINSFTEFIEDKFSEFIEEEKDGFSDVDCYYFIFSDGKISNDPWDDHQIDKDRLSIGNIFKSIEEVEFAVEKLKVLHELKELGRPFKPGIKNYYFEFSELESRTRLSWCNTFRYLYFDCYFDSEEDAQQAINKIGEDRIKKYLFSVKD